MLSLSVRDQGKESEGTREGRRRHVKQEENIGGTRERKRRL